MYLYYHSKGGKDIIMWNNRYQLVSLKGLNLTQLSTYLDFLSNTQESSISQKNSSHQSIESHLWFYKGNQWEESKAGSSHRISLKSEHINFLLLPTKAENKDPLRPYKGILRP